MSPTFSVKRNKFVVWNYDNKKSYELWQIIAIPGKVFFLLRMIKFLNFLLLYMELSHYFWNQFVENNEIYSGTKCKSSISGT